MEDVYHDIFRAIHEGKWLSIKYQNQNGNVTKYWIGIRDLDMPARTLAVDGFHLDKYTTDSYDRIYIDSILSSQVVEGTYYPVNQNLVQDIYLNPYKYRSLFAHTANMEILDYLENCYLMDRVPYYTEFGLVQFLDQDSFDGKGYPLSEEQFQMIVGRFQKIVEEKDQRDGTLEEQQLAMNVLSIHTKQGLYPLLYRELNLDVKNKVLCPALENTICEEYKLGGHELNIHQYLDADEYDLILDYEKNRELIKDCITKNTHQVIGVDDMPYIIELSRKPVVDFREIYWGIDKQYRRGQVSAPIRAFFGELVQHPQRETEYPLITIDKKINLDQLLAIHNGMKYPLSYVQGPPGTGKTNTIVNTIVTALFNERTVLVSSYNNHPLDSIFEILTKLNYRGRPIPFPVLRLGDMEKEEKALDYIKQLCAQAERFTIFESTLDKKKAERIERSKKLSDLLKNYEKILDLRGRSETLNQMVEYQHRNQDSVEILPFQQDLEDRQQAEIQEKIHSIGEITEKDALDLLDTDFDQLHQYLYFISASQIKKIFDKRYRELYDIVFEDKKEDRRLRFSEYLKKTENVKMLQEIFPIIITTCISAQKLGEPEPMFDMVIMDEASQCNNAVSLVPIIRGENLMLVGDPQQLKPVIKLDAITNEKLRKTYHVPDEYDYLENSIYSTFLSCDVVSDEVLLRHHYRCNKKIIDFNNQKYYNSRLSVCSKSKEKEPLVYMNVKNDHIVGKNTAPEEVNAIVEYIKQNPDKNIGVITPFVNQKRLIQKRLMEENLENVTCGTVHAFQGDQKDVILFSTAITDYTTQGTYRWLKNNKQLINVATSRAKDKLVLVGDSKNLSRLHKTAGNDDMYELMNYVQKNGQTQVTPKRTNSRALGEKPFSAEVEEAFLANLKHALENISLSNNQFSVKKNVDISQVFEDYTAYEGLFYSNQIDFVVYAHQISEDVPVLAIEVDGKERYHDEVVKNLNKKKQEVCAAHNIQLICVEQCYARRYNHMKEILMEYFSVGNENGTM